MTGVMVTLGTRCSGGHRQWHIRVQRPRKPYCTIIGFVRVNVDGVNNFYYLPTEDALVKMHFRIGNMHFPKIQHQNPALKNDLYVEDCIPRYS